MATTPQKRTQLLRLRRRPNRYDRWEAAGAFGDLGTFIPFVMAYITVVGFDPAALLLSFGLAKIAVGLYYRTPVPVQPMKALGAAAFQPGITPGMVRWAGLATGLLWLVFSLTGAIAWVSRLAPRPVVQGIVLGLGLSLAWNGLGFMAHDLGVALPALVLTYLLLGNRRFPAMFVLLLLGVAVAWWRQPSLGQELLAQGLNPSLPLLGLPPLRWDDMVGGIVLLALPQLPLTLGNAVIAITAENNTLFPDAPLSEAEAALTTGLMNLGSFALGGVPLCHGAGGMAGHVRFGARTGGALVVLGTVLCLLALLFGSGVGLVLELFPEAILGVLLFFAGVELALTSREGLGGEGFPVVLATAAFGLVNIGAAFAVGVALHEAWRRGWVRF